MWGSAGGWGGDDLVGDLGGLAEHDGDAAVGLLGEVHGALELAAIEIVAGEAVGDVDLIVDLGMLIGELPIDVEGEALPGHPHLLEDRHHVHARAASEGAQQQRLRLGAVAPAAELFGGVDTDVAALEIDIEGHAVLPGYGGIISRHCLPLPMSV